MRNIKPDLNWKNKIGDITCYWLVSLNKWNQSFQNFVGNLRKSFIVTGLFNELMQLFHKLWLQMPSPWWTINTSLWSQLTFSGRKTKQTSILEVKKVRHAFRNHAFLFELQILATTSGSKNYRTGISPLKQLSGWNAKKKKKKRTKN